jgi:photosystem II stability/assembly factor-like uncharacterized protein
MSKILKFALSKSVLILKWIVLPNLLIGQCWEDATIIGQNHFSHSKIQFLNDKVGYCQEQMGTIEFGVATDFVYKTIDGGKTWKNYIRAKRETYEGYYVVNESLIFLYGKYTIARSDDGGQTWTAPIQNNNYIFREMFFINNDIGWATSYPGNIWKTINGGKKWDIIFNRSPTSGPSPNVGNPIIFLNENVGFLLTNKLYKTTNGGITWQDLEIWHPTDFQILENQLIVLTEKLKIIFDINGNIMSSVNHIFHPSNTMGSLSGIFRANFCFIDEKTGWYASTEGIHYTKDGGLNWGRIYSKRTSDIYFNKKGTGILIGYDFQYNYYHTCSFEQHDKDYYDRCYFAYRVLNPFNYQSLSIATDYSRLFYLQNDAYTTPKPSCWSTSNTNIQRPYWITFEGNNKNVSIEINKNSLQGGQYLKAALYTGECKNLTIVGCAQIDEFNNLIKFNIYTEKNKQYFILFDGESTEYLKFNVILNSVLVNSNDYEKDEKINVYPIPSSSILYINDSPVKLINNSNYQLIDTQGRIIQEGKVIDNFIDISLIYSGIYLFKLTSSTGNIYIKKIIKY